MITSLRSADSNLDAVAVTGAAAAVSRPQAAEPDQAGAAALTHAAPTTAALADAAPTTAAVGDASPADPAPTGPAPTDLAPVTASPGTPAPATPAPDSRPGRPALRVVRPPALEPPYEDDPGPARHLRLIRGADPAGRHTRRRRPPSLTLAEPLDHFGPQPTSRRDLPDPARYAAQLVQAALEVIGGRRPLQQLMPHLTGSAYVRLSARLARGLRSRPGGPGPAARHTVVSVRVCEPRDGVAEVSLVVRHGDRMHAVAVRLEGADSRWRCTVLELL